MRQVTQQAAYHFVAFEPYKNGNTTVCVHYANGGVTRATMYLHGNLIASITNGAEASLNVTLAGYNTATTKERPNGICEVLRIKCRFTTKNFAPHFGATEIHARTVVHVRQDSSSIIFLRNME